jgi:hypothetical protein
MTIAVDPEQLAAFVAALFKYADDGTWISLRAFRDDVDNEPPVAIQGVQMNCDLTKIAQAATALARRCADHPHPAVFCPPICTLTNKDKADERSLANGLALSVELDADAERGRKRLEFLFGVPATVAVASGGTYSDPTGEPKPKLHCHWRLKEPTRDSAAHMRLKQARAMATALVGGDASNKPIVHPIRWPGSVHRKAEPKLCQIVALNPDAELDLQEAISILLDIQPEFRKTEAPGGKIPGDGEDRETPELVRAILTGEDYHSTLLALAMRYLKRGMAAEHVTLTLRGLMRSVPPECRDGDRPGRWQARYDDIPRTVRQGQEKLAQEQTTPSAANIPYTLLCDIKPSLDRNDIVRELVPRRAFGEVHAESAGGKTAILIDLCLHIAAGIEYRGRRTERQPVVFVAFEGQGGIDNRVYAAALEIGIADAPFALIKIATSFKDPEVAKKVADIAGRLMRNFGGDCPVIVVDTYTAALGSGASDCDPRDVTAFIANVQQHLLTACSVVLTHHFGKDPSRGGRGWSGLRAALDFELEIDQDGDLRTMRLTKSRDGSDRQPVLCYRFRGREIGRNLYDEPVTAVVVEHLADEAVATRGKRYSPKARAALNKLWDCIKDPSRSFPMPEEPGLRCVVLDAWETACTAQGAISNSPRLADRSRQFRAAKDELEEAGAVICDGEGGERVRPAPKGRGEGK